MPDREDALLVVAADLDRPLVLLLLAALVVNALGMTQIADVVSEDYAEGRELRHVLKDASLSVDEGEFVAIRGMSGSGKSTVLNLVAGIDRPTFGEIFFGETALGRLSPRERTLLRRAALFTGRRTTLRAYAALLLLFMPL